MYRSYPTYSCIIARPRAHTELGLVSRGRGDQNTEYNLAHARAPRAERRPAPPSSLDPHERSHTHTHARSGCSRVHRITYGWKCCARVPAYSRARAGEGGLPPSRAAAAPPTPCAAPVAPGNLTSCRSPSPPTLLSSARGCCPPRRPAPSPRPAHRCRRRRPRRPPRARCPPSPGATTRATRR